MKKSNLMPSIVLGCICLVAALLLSVVNTFTAPIIANRQKEAASGAFAEVLPGATGKEDITIDASYPSIVKEGYKFDNGFVFQMEVTGKDSGFVIMVGIDLDGKVTGAKVISNKETPSYAATVFADIKAVDNTYVGVDLDNFAPALVAGATLTSSAYGEAVKAALQAFAIANGATVDTRTEEEKFQDACNELLGTTKLTYTKWFATEIITGIDAVYETEGNNGRIYKIGDKLIGIKPDGTVVSSDATADDKAKAIAADNIIKAGSITAIETLPAGVDTSIVKAALVTDSGNYVFELEGEGYAAWEGTPISILVSISADGKIIDVVTVEHDESKGIGDKCATDSYYEQWINAESGDIKITVEKNDIDEYGPNKIPADCTDIGAIAGATFTTYGYQSAIQAAFAAFELLTEGGND